MITAHQQIPKPLNDRHHKECVEKRGLDPQWIGTNCYSTTANEATQYLGYTAQSDGIWLEGCNHQSQFKPDKPWLSEQDKAKGEKKPPKYRSPLGEYDAMLPTHPTDPHYWDNLDALKQKAFKIDGHPCLVITEGFFKAISGCSIGIPTIALLGVEEGLTPSKADPQRKRYLVPTLERYAKAGFGFIIAFDADCATNKAVIWAQYKLAHQLKLFKVPVYSVTGLWSCGVKGEDKGMDDYIKNHGGDHFIVEVMGKAVDITAWEKQFQPPEEFKTGKVPPADILGRELAESYQDKLAFNNETLTWMRYEADYPGVWSSETQEFVESLIATILESKSIKGYNSPSYVSNVTRAMRHWLIVRKWLEQSPKELLPFQNGVLEVATGKLLPHSPSYHFTWSLPRVHNPLAHNWEPIERWMDEATGSNPGIKKILLCWLNTVLKGRSDLQRFLHLSGPGGSGKGTFTRLCIALIGERNNYSSSLEDWNGNRFETANAYRKRLVSFPDEDKYSGGLGRFKSLTGGDFIRGEEKGKKAFQYIYDGMVVVASNYPIFCGDTSSGLARRLLMVPFNHQVPKGRRRDLDKEFIPYLDALTNYVLNIPDEEVTSTLLQSEDELSEVIEQSWDYRMRTDSIAAWLNEYVIHDPEAMTSVGNDKDDATALFGSYWQYCQRTGSRAKGSREFSPSLLDLCNHILGWSDVSKVARNNGKFIKGLRLRSDGDDHIPNPIEALSTGSVTDGDPSRDGWGDESKPALGKESDGSDGSDSSNQLGDAPQKNLSFPEILPSSETVTRDLLSLDAGEASTCGAQESLTLAEPSNQVSTTTTPSLKVGDRVKIVWENSRYQGQTGKLLRVVKTEEGKTRYVVQPDGTNQKVEYEQSDLKRV